MYGINFNAIGIVYLKDLHDCEQILFHSKGDAVIIYGNYIHILHYQSEKEIIPSCYNKLLLSCCKGYFKGTSYVKVV